MIIVLARIIYSYSNFLRVRVFSSF